jgi:hypothetical protein
VPEAGPGAVAREDLLARLERDMFAAAEKLDFELAASLRDRMLEMRLEASAGAETRRRRWTPPGQTRKRKKRKRWT